MYPVQRLLLISFNSYIQCFQGIRHCHFHIIIGCTIYYAPVLSIRLILWCILKRIIRIIRQLLHNNLFVYRQFNKLPVYVFYLCIKQASELLYQLIKRKVYVSITCCLKERVHNSALYSKVRIGSYSCLSCYLVGNLKADTGYIIRKSVRILPQYGVNTCSILVVNFHCKSHRDSIVLQKHHRTSHVSLCCDTVRYLRRHPRADSLNLSKSFRLLFYNPKRIRLESSHDS